MLGTTISHYRITDKLGEGGMGVVYKAEDLKLGRAVALKFLPPHLLDSEEHKARFLHEARAAALLDHPNICTVYEIDEADGQTFLAMACLGGQTLKQKIAARPLPLAEALDIAVQIGQGLQAAHEKGIVHRDIKPANIMITPQGQVKIMDFGLAQLSDRTKLTASGMKLGTPAYMSPEQTEGKPADRRSDIWALGVVLYEMISGRVPFPGEAEAAVAYAIVHAEPEPLTALRSGIPLDLDRTVEKALAKDPAERYQNIADLIVDLRVLRPGTVKSRTLGKSRRRRKAAYAASVFAAAALLGAIAALNVRKESAPAPRPAQYEQITAFTDSAVQPALSPDGRMVTFLRGPATFTTSGQVYVKLLPHGEPVQLTRDSLRKMSPRFSPDGSRIAYTVVGVMDGAWDTWVVPTLGGDPRLWLPNASGLVWTGPGRLLFSEIKHGIHMAIVAASESRTEARDVYMPLDDRGMMHRSHISPDGRWILGAEMDRNGWIPCRLVPFDGSDKGRAVGPSAGACTDAAWSPDGRWMYLTTDASGSQQLWRQRFPDGEPEQLTFGPTVAEGIAVAPDSASLITSMGLTQRSVWVHDGARERQISSEGDATMPAWGDGIPNSVFSPDGQRLYYLVRRGPSRSFGGGEMWVRDLASGNNESFLPGYTVASYDVSSDGKSVVFSVVDGQRKSRLWLASTDRRFPPRQLPPNEAMGPVFGAHNNVFYRAPEGELDYIYELNLDSGAIRKAFPEPAINAPTVSPDGEWIVTTVPTGEPEFHVRVVAYPRGGGPPVSVCQMCIVKWTGDRKSLFLTFGPGNSMGEQKTFVIRLTPGRMLPPFPAGLIRSEADLTKVPVERTIPGVDVFPGPTASQYAFVRQAVHRNLYRIPIQ